MKPVELTFYVNEISHHVGGLLDALNELPEVAGVTLITEAPVAPERIALGWQAKLEGKYRHLEAPSGATVARHVEEAGSEAIHIFIGMRHLRCVTSGIAACIRLSRRFGLMHEPRVREGWRGTLRYVQSWATESRIRQHGLFVLAIGAHGPSWFRNTGYSSAQIFPFAYFIARSDYAEPLRAERAVGPVQIGYLGRLEQSKGFGDALEAICHIRSGFSFSIVGTGSMSARAHEFAARHPRGAYIGVLPMREVQRHLKSVDILIQPSRTTDDGWGVVVSEALLSGAAVVTSDAVGASACLAEPWRGRVVPVRQPQAIASAVDALIAEDLLNANARLARACWAEQRLTGTAGARYLMDILFHLIEGAPRPPSFLE